MPAGQGVKPLRGGGGGGGEKGEEKEEEEKGEGEGDRKGREASEGLRSQQKAEPKLWHLCSCKPHQKLGHGLELGALISFLSLG